MVSLALVLVVLLTVGVVRSLAQNTTGSIQGTVTDANGGSVANVTETITNADRNAVIRIVKTDENGEYTAPLMPIGNYTVTAEADGFKKVTHSGVVLNVNDKLRVNIALEVGALSDTVNVEADALRVDTLSVTPTGLITGTQECELFIGTRNYEQLVSLMPGVLMGNLNQIYIGNSLPSGAAATASFSING